MLADVMLSLNWDAFNIRQKEMFYLGQIPTRPNGAKFPLAACHHPLGRELLARINLPCKRNPAGRAQANLFT
jgi:hypothetical protein